MDQTNPAVTRQTTISPAFLDLVDKDPSLLKKLSLKMLSVQVDALHMKFRDPNLPVGQRLQFADFLAKISDAYPKANAPAIVAPGSGFSVNIIMNNEPSAATKVPVVEVVDVKATEMALTNDMVGNHEGDTDAG